MMYKMSKLLIAVYLCLTDDRMLKEVFLRERKKATWKNPVREAEIAVEEVGHDLELLVGEVVLDGKRMEGKPEEIRQRVSKQFKEWWMQMLVKEYEAKVLKSVIWKEIRTLKTPGFQWMGKNITPDQVARVLRVQEQTIQTKFLAKIRGKDVGDIRCRLCKKAVDGVKHWLSSCEYLARREYLKRHDQTLRVLYAEVLKQHGMEEETTSWYNIEVEVVRENARALVVWNLRIPTHTKVEHRWPDLRIEDKRKKWIWILDMSCPSDDNVVRKEEEKYRNYQDLVYELRTQRPGWKIMVVPLIVGVTGAMNNLKAEVEKLLGEERRTRRCVEEMQKTTVLGSLQMIHRIEAGLV
jgi:hypothetical protein